ncbi:MAG: hypothetical protein O2960_24945 [Verrucomicrobia bacterium]|nr:hypothetical protein [Verrucomicrobiota bacterium]
MELLTHPFSLGLGAGILLAAAVWINGILKRRGLAKEVKSLREHLHTQMGITARGNESTKKDLEDLRKQCENLRVTNATLKQKPGRAELATLALYDKALHIMQAKAPGFAPAWENILKDAEAEIQKIETGLLPMIRNVFRPSLSKAARNAQPLNSQSDFAETDQSENVSVESNRPASS